MKTIARYVAFAVLAIVNSSEANAQGNLLITPRRVLFEGNKRSEELNLANVGKDTATYVISFIQIRMKEDGSFENITTPDSGQNFADKHLRFFPRTVTLGPNEAQTLKVQLMRPNELAPGEYRSHIYFRAVPNNKPLGEPEPGKNDSTVSVRLIPVFGISIPAIVRIGESTGAVTLSNSNFKIENDTIPVVEMNLNRSGNTSVYGDISVDHISPYGKVTHVGLANGVAVYTPLPLRKFKVALNRRAGADLGSGTLRIMYTDQTPRKSILAQQEIVIN